MAEPIEILFGGRFIWGPRNHIICVAILLDGYAHLTPPEKYDLKICVWQQCNHFDLVLMTVVLVLVVTAFFKKETHSYSYSIITNYGNHLHTVWSTILISWMQHGDLVTVPLTYWPQNCAVCWAQAVLWIQTFHWEAHMPQTDIIP